eukprot:6352375-Alexandrium_andersonii.AAC.1
MRASLIGDAPRAMRVGTRSGGTRRVQSKTNTALAFAPHPPGVRPRPQVCARSARRKIPGGEGRGVGPWPK